VDRSTAFRSFGLAIRLRVLYGRVPKLVSGWRSGDAVSVQNVVLGELIKRRGYGYGYELRDQLREFSEALGYSDTFVYAALVALERQGLVQVVEREDEPADLRRSGARRVRSRQFASRVYYKVTDSGKSHYRAWMAGVARKAPLREELHMQLMAAEPADLPHLVEALRHFEEQCRAQLRQIIEQPLGSRRAREGSIGATFVHDALFSHLQTSMEWAQRTRVSLQKRLDRPIGAPGRRRP
jgi:DNA-binding PadR family transcriptional regulator